MKATFQSEGERPAQIEGSPRFEPGTLDVILAIQSRGGAIVPSHRNNKGEEIWKQDLFVPIHLLLEKMPR